MYYQKAFAPIFIIIAVATVVASISGIYVYKRNATDTDISPQPKTQQEKIKNDEVPPSLRPTTKPFTQTTKPISSPPPQKTSPSANAFDLTKISGEISILAQTGKPIGPEHYARLKNSLETALAQGASPTETQLLQSLLEPLNPEKISTLTSASQGFRKDPEIPSAEELKQVPSCAGQTFSTPPVDTGKLYSVSPLGNLGPPGHTFPTEHMFFHITAGGVTTDTIQLSAPADIYVTLISFSHGLTQDPVDYTVWFALCKDVVGYYNHVKALSPQLEEIVAKNNCQFSGETKTTRCNIETLTKVNNATSMGRVGRLQGNFDFGLLDLRKKHVFANPSRYGTRSLYIQCALEYFEPMTQSRLFSFIKRTDEKKCGFTAQDIPGTLKGNWFFGNSRADSGSDWDKYLAFVQDSGDPELFVISVGGTFTGAGKWEFKPTSSGTTNRAFQEVTADNKIYCYESNGKTGRIAVQMTSATELKIEQQSKSCDNMLNFSSPTIYTR